MVVYFKQAVGSRNGTAWEYHQVAEFSAESFDEARERMRGAWWLTGIARGMAITRGMRNGDIIMNDDGECMTIGSLNLDA